MSSGNDHFVPQMMDKRRVCSNLGLSPMRRKKGENKSRFSEKQVKMLEEIFKAETKIEPMKKVQLALELGLEPRQVGIWFQNRRARWKSKNLEKEFCILRGNYENLASLVGSLKDENHSLHLQVQNLSLALERNGRSTSKESGNTGKALNNLANMNFLAQELVQEYQCLDELGDSSQASTDLDWCNADAGNIFEQSCYMSQWWDFQNC